jgi:fucose permease
MLFNFVGGYFSATFYLVSYVLETTVINSSSGSILVLVLWLSITIGRVIGIADSRSLMPPNETTNKTLRFHMTVLMMFSIVSSFLIAVLPSNGAVLWTFVAIYGFTIGPCVGFAFDLSNRITKPDPTTMSFVMHGLNAGANLCPFFVSLWWDYGGGPTALFWIIFIGVTMSLPLLYLAFHLDSK